MLASGAVGVLGQNVLGIADMEYDLANGVIRLMRPDGCGYQPLGLLGTSPPFSAVDIGSSDVKTADLEWGEPHRARQYGRIQIR